MNEGNSAVVVDLFKANTQCFLRLAELAQQAGMQGLGRSQQLMAASVTESTEEIQAFLATKDFPELVAVQLQCVRRRWEKRVGALQQVLQSEAQSPGSVAGGLTQAFKDGIQPVSGIKAGAGGAADLNGFWANYLNQFTRLWPAAESASAKKSVLLRRRPGCRIRWPSVSFHLERIAVGSNKHRTRHVHGGGR